MKSLPLPVFVGRSLLVAIRPRHVIRSITPEQTLCLASVVAVIMAVTFVDVLIHYRMVFGRWIWQHQPAWLSFTFGWACFNLNQWLLAIVALRVLHRALGAAARPAAHAVAAYYLIGGVWTWSIAVDALHPLMGLQPVEVHVPWLAWLYPPIFGNWARLSWVIIFPWASLALWLILTDVLGVQGTWRRLVGAACALTLPVAGRMLVEPLPNIVMHVWTQAMGRRPPGGWVVLGTQAVLLVLASLLVWLGRAPQTGRSTGQARGPA